MREWVRMAVNKLSHNKIIPKWWSVTLAHFNVQCCVFHEWKPFFNAVKLLRRRNFLEKRKNEIIMWKHFAISNSIDCRTHSIVKLKRWPSFLFNGATACVYAPVDHLEDRKKTAFAKRSVKRDGVMNQIEWQNKCRIENYYYYFGFWMDVG